MQRDKLGLTVEAEVETYAFPETKGSQLHYQLVRELEPADVLKLQTAAVGSQTPALKKLGHRHLMVARLLAQGVKPVEISAITGMSQSRISILKNDPSFSDLLQQLEEQTFELVDSMQKKMNLLAHDVIDVLSERIEETPDEFKSRELLELLNSLNDRSGHGVKTTQRSEHLHAVATLEELQELKDKVKREQKGEVKTGTYEILSPSSASED